MPNITMDRLKEKDGNCLLYGCASLVLVSILAALAFWLTFQFMIGRVRDQYTDSIAIELPRSQMPRDEINQLIDRVDAYASSIRNNESVEPTSLTQDEINALIQYHPELTPYAGLVYITIEGEELTGQLSVPLDGIPGLEGRYFNGSATLTMSLQDDEFVVYVDEASLNGEPLPEEVLQNIREINLVREAQSEPEAQALVANIESISVKDGVITIVPANKKLPQAP